MDTVGKRVRLHITGRVQGVFFRASAQRKAQELGLAGWVRNEPDGSVMAEAEGDAESLDAFIQWCKQGPAHAVVSKVTEDWQEPNGEESFQIRYA